jgi:isoquinoline 1-oxidoreductase subunit beta
MNTTLTRVSRRTFLKSSAALGGGLIIGFYLPNGRQLAAAEGADKRPVYPPNAFVRIAPDNTVTVLCKHSEMGQGVLTSVAMLVAEELECDWRRVRSEHAPNAPVYSHTAFHIQMTGGSTSVADSWVQMRTIGAQLRTMLVQAAAENWGVDPGSCRAANGYVIHDASKRRASFGELAERAAKLPLPEKVALKAPKDFKLLGRPQHRLDAREKVDGSGKFGIDARVPGMLYAVVARPPTFGGKAVSFNADRAKAVRGVQQVVQVPSGIAVIGNSYWTASQGRNALEIQWDAGPHAALSTEALRKQYRELAMQPGLPAHKDGDASAALAGAAKRIEAEYEVPYLAHAPMEPLNCLVHVTPDKCEIWSGTQFQTMDAMRAAEVAGLKPEQVVIHTMLLGGGFGRRANPDSDFIKEAVAVAKAAGKPVMTVWSREDDIKGGYYRPMWLDRLTAGLDGSGKPVAWAHTIVGQSILSGTPFEQFLVKNSIDATSVEGAAELPYSIPNVHVSLHSPKQPVPVQWWRSVGHSHTGFVVESFIDELAAAAGRDPLEFRRALLDAKHARHRAVLDLVAAKSNWGKPLAKGRARGLALHESFNSVIAQVAEVSLQEKRVRVHRVVSAVHCGFAVNPDGVRQQIEGGTIFGLSAALYGQVTLKDGRVEQSNFHDYPIVRLNETPLFETHIVPSSDDPTGLGEPGTPLIAAVVCNALAALTGRRIRALPLSAQAFEHG